MSISSKILPAVALALALSPVAAHARQDRQPGPAQYYLAPLSHHHERVRVSEVTASSATIDNPTTLYGGVTANTFRDFMGG